MNHRNLTAALSIGLYLLAASCFAVPEDRDKPITGSADKNTIDANTGKTILIDNVVIIQGHLKIIADVVTIETDEQTNELTYMLAEGAPVKFYDTPELDSDEIEVTGNRIEFFPNEDLIITLGNAQITQTGNIAKGERIEYNTITGIMKITSERTITGNQTDKQAEMIIQPGALK